jgi:ribosomal protein S27E
VGQETQKKLLKRTESANHPISQSKHANAKAYQVKCPECGSENVKSQLSFTTIVAWVGRILGVQTVKIWEKRCAECGHEFQVFRK